MGGDAFLSMIGVSRAGLFVRFGCEEARLAEALNVFVWFNVNGVSLPDKL